MAAGIMFLVANHLNLNGNILYLNRQLKGARAQKIELKSTYLKI